MVQVTWFANYPAWSAAKLHLLLMQTKMQHELLDLCLFTLFAMVGGLLSILNVSALESVAA